MPNKILKCILLFFSRRFTIYFNSIKALRGSAIKKVNLTLIQGFQKFFTMEFFFFFFFANNIFVCVCGLKVQPNAFVISFSTKYRLFLSVTVPFYYSFLFMILPLTILCKYFINLKLENFLKSICFILK